MKDEQIIALYQSRDQDAISQTAQKYGHYCYSIANHILRNQEDAEESVSDTYLMAWNKIPPTHPSIFSAFLGTITRNLSLNKWHSRTAAKRGGGEILLVLDELEEFLPGGDMPEENYLKKEAAMAINRFLESLTVTDRQVIMRRYWYLDSVPEIAKRYGYSEAKVKSILRRGWGKLKAHFEEEGLL